MHGHKEYIIWFKCMSFVKVLQGFLIIFQHPFDIYTLAQIACIVWLKNMNFVKVFQGSLIIFQLCFDISIDVQSECIVWFNNLSIVKVLQSSLNIFLTFPHFLKVDVLFGSRTSLKTSMLTRSSNAP